MPVQTPPPAPKKAATLSVSNLAGVVYTQDGKRVESREGSLGDKLFDGDKLGVGQYVEVRQGVGARSANRECTAVAPQDVQRGWSPRACRIVGG